MEFNLALLDKTATATILIFVGAILGRYAYKVTNRILQKAKVVNKLKAFGIKRPIKLLSNLSQFAIYIFILMLLIKLDIVELIIDILLLVVIVFLIFAILFIIKDVTKNVYFNSKIKQKLKQGQIINISGLKGVITKVSLDEIRITTTEDNLAVISKEYLAKNKFKIQKQ